MKKECCNFCEVSNVYLAEYESESVVDYVLTGYRETGLICKNCALAKDQNQIIPTMFDDLTEDIEF